MHNRTDLNQEQEKVQASKLVWKIEKVWKDQMNPKGDKRNKTVKLYKKKKQRREIELAGTILKFAGVYVL